jgi:hypothetical protein
MCDRWLGCSHVQYGALLMSLPVGPARAAAWRAVCAGMSGTHACMLPCLQDMSHGPAACMFPGSKVHPIDIHTMAHIFT